MVGCRFRRVGRSWDGRWTSRAVICRNQDLRGRFGGEKEAMKGVRRIEIGLLESLGEERKLRGCGKYNKEGG